jgi:hypothetical protein
MKKTNVFLLLAATLLAAPSLFAQTSPVNPTGLRSPAVAKVDVETAQTTTCFGAQNTNPSSATQMLLYGDDHNFLGMGVLGSNNSYFGAGSQSVAYIYTSGNKPLLFATGSTERARFLANGQVGIGTSAPLAQSRLMVVKNFADAGQQDSVGTIHGETNYNGSPNSDAPGVYGKNTVRTNFGLGVGGQGGYIGVKGVALPKGTFYGYGGYFTATGGSASSNYNAGVFANASTSENRPARGVYTTASSTGTTQTYGVYASAGGSASTTYGIYASTSSGATRYAGYFNGNVTVTGTFIEPSDRSLKRNIHEVEGSLDKVMRLRPTEYEYLPERQKSMNLAEGPQMGFIAQELQKVLPNAVTKNVQYIEDDSAEANPSDRSRSSRKAPEKVEYLGINYISIIPLLTGAIQDQQKSIEAEKAKNDALQAQVQLLESRLAAIEQRLGQQATPTGGYLKQNAPNPFDRETRIEYSLPANTAQAVLYVTDMTGRVLSSQALDASGLAIIKANALPKGVYNYSLVADGKLLESRQMVLTK